MGELVTQIECPSKWDIIPLHTSDRATFKSCRRKWFWSSPAQQNLVQKASVYGIYLPFWFGTGIHYALEKFYHPVLREDPEVAFDSWYNIQWNGGPIRDDELDQFKDRKPYLKDDVWYVDGLADVLPDPDPDEFETHHQLGLGMMRFYKDYAERNDDFTVVCSEHEFSVPVLDPDGKPVYMLDTREMPEDWEPTLEGNELGPFIIYNHAVQENVMMKQVHARGRMDLIIQDSEGHFGLKDYKTVGHALSEDYFAHTDLDEQITTYAWAAELEANLYDLPYKNLDFIIYEALRKAYPKPPTITTRGLPSMDKSKESTTAYLFEKTIKDLGLKPIFDSDTKMQAYYTYLVEQGDKQFVWRYPVRRNKAQKENAGYRIYMEALDMLDDPRIYPSPRNDWSCLKCIFRQPCLAVEAGYDWESMIADNYEKNYDR